MRPVLLLLFLFQLRFGYGGKPFRLGRSRYGNLGAPAGASDADLPPAQWIDQKLDHFSPSDLRVWQQRYFVNDKYFDIKNPGPVFLMVGGEGPADPRWMVKGHWIEIAKQFNALCLMLEHRYYGGSHPTRDMSVKNLQYLSSSQALADLASFISYINEMYHFKTNEVKWVAFGGSYPGSLAAWMRLEYPHLVHAAVSTSGPLIAKVDFQEYFRVVVESLREKTGSDQCVNEIKQAYRQIEQLMHTDIQEISSQFKLCSPFESANSNDINTFFSTLADYFADLVQYNEDNRISGDEKYRNITINTVCDMFTDSKDSTESYKKLAAYNTIMLEKAKQPCFDFRYENMINEYRNTTFGESSEGGRQWMYQTCTEFGFYQTSSAEVDVFGNHFDLDYFIQQCKDIFGLKYDKKFISAAAAWTNTKYGGLDIPAKRVVYVQGSVDPWHALGLTVTEDNDAPVIFIRGTAHCANMYPPSEKDSEQLTEARLEIVQYLSSWLGLL